MRIKGVTYDTGFINAGVNTKEIFDVNIVKREMEIIKNDLQCNGIRITGGDADRLEITAKLAAMAGLEVWYCPFTCNLTMEELQNFLVDAAERAEAIRCTGAEVVFLTGSEISLFTKGFFSNDDLNDRIDVLKNPTALREKLPEVRIKLNEYLKEAVQLVRKKFHGKISYASLPFEGVDWSLFDVIATDGAYRTAGNAASYETNIGSFASQGKPAAITEFGCGSYTGAGDNAANSLWIIDWVDGRPEKLNVNYERNESEQARYILELFKIFETKKIDAAFITSFAAYSLPHRKDPLRDLDMGSYGIVKVYEDKCGETYPDMPWEPKEAFWAIANYIKV